MILAKWKHEHIEYRLEREIDDFFISKKSLVADTIKWIQVLNIPAYLENRSSSKEDQTLCALVWSILAGNVKLIKHRTVRKTYGVKND